MAMCKTVVGGSGRPTPSEQLLGQACVAIARRATAGRLYRVGGWVRIADRGHFGSSHEPAFPYRLATLASRVLARWCMVEVASSCDVAVWST